MPLHSIFSGMHYIRSQLIYFGKFGQNFVSIPLITTDQIGTSIFQELAQSDPFGVDLITKNYFEYNHRLNKR